MLDINTNKKVNVVYRQGVKSNDEGMTTKYTIIKLIICIIYALSIAACSVLIEQY